MVNIRWPQYLSQYDVVCEQQSRRWTDGTPLGNGSLAALAFEPHHLEWTINKNDVWDYRHPQFKRHSMARIRRIARADLDYATEMQMLCWVGKPQPSLYYRSLETARGGVRDPGKARRD